MLTCKEILDLTSKELDTSIPKFKRLEIMLHMFVCKNCKQYGKQLAVLQKLSSKLEDGLQKITLPNEAKQRIENVLKQYHKK